MLNEVFVYVYKMNCDLIDTIKCDNYSNEMNSIDIELNIESIEARIKVETEDNEINENSNDLSEFRDTSMNSFEYVSAMIGKNQSTLVLKSEPNLNDYQEVVDNNINRKQLPKQYKTFKCVKCEKSFKNLLTLQKHFNNCAQESADDKVLKCRDCHQIFVSSVSGGKQLKDHANEMHGGFYVCDWDDCEYRTKLKPSLVNHMRRHQKDKPFACDWPECDYRAVDNQLIHLHKKRCHSDEKLYVCRECDQSFKFVNYLNRHIATKHCSVKAFKCDECGKPFGVKRDLSSHIKTVHTRAERFKCDQCDHVTHCKKYLKRHRRSIHLKERPHMCSEPECGKSYFSKSKLDSHRLSAHSDERQFVCDWPECSSTFKIKSNLTTHIKTIHTGEYKTKKKRLKRS